MADLPNRPCPCGSGTPYDGCCEPLHDGRVSATTAAQLMRSRYAAYALGRLDYVFRTWHPRTRPAEIGPDPTTTWVGLEVVDTAAGDPDDDDGEVEFAATHVSGGTRGVLHERSRFTRRRGRWVYVGDTPITNARRV